MNASDDITIEPHEEIVLAVFQCGRMEEEHAAIMQEAVAPAAERQRNLPLVLDLSQVASIPSQGIGALVALWRASKEADQRFILVGLQPAVRESLTICRLDKFFEIFDSIDEALSRIRQSS